jgi:hypothetical protein
VRHPNWTQSKDLPNRNERMSLIEAISTPLLTGETGHSRTFIQFASLRTFFSDISVMRAFETVNLVITII